jgi:hypothetical protein
MVVFESRSALDPFKRTPKNLCSRSHKEKTGSGRKEIIRVLQTVKKFIHGAVFYKKLAKCVCPHNDLYVLTLSTCSIIFKGYPYCNCKKESI